MGVRNTLADMHNILFEQLERLNDEEPGSEQLNKEIERAKAITTVAKAITNNATLMLNAKKHADEYGHESKELPILIGDGK